MKKIFVTMLMAAAATVSFAQNEKFDKEVKATKDYNAGLELINSKLAELTDEQKGKAYSELYKLAKPDFDKSSAAAQEGKNDQIDNKAVKNAIFAAYECAKYDAKTGVKYVEEVKNFRPMLINAANQAEDNDEKLAYSKAYIESAQDGDGLIELANFFAAYACYSKQDYKAAASFAKGALKDDRVSAQAEQIYRVSLESDMKTREDSLAYIDALKSLDMNKYFVNICNMYTDMGMKDKVNSLVDEALAADPNNKFAYYTRGTVKNDAKNFNGAIEDFKKVVEIDPQFVYGYFNLSLCYAAIGEDIQFTKAVNGRLLGENLAACNEAYKNAIETMEKVRELDPNHETINNWPRLLRMYYNNIGQKDKAAEISKLIGDE